VDPGFYIKLVRGAVRTPAPCQIRHWYQTLCLFACKLIVKKNTLVLKFIHIYEKTVDVSTTDRLSRLLEKGFSQYFFNKAVNIGKA